MSEKPDKKPESAPHCIALPPRIRKPGAACLTKLPVLMGGAMILEAVVLFAGFKFLGGGSPKTVSGAELAGESHELPRLPRIFIARRG